MHMGVELEVSAKGMHYSQNTRNSIRTPTSEHFLGCFGSAVHHDLYQRTVFKYFLPKPFGNSKNYMAMGNIDDSINGSVYPFVYVSLTTRGAKATLAGKRNFSFSPAFGADILCIP
jgi:hypothetical protein